MSGGERSGGLLIGGEAVGGGKNAGRSGREECEGRTGEVYGREMKIWRRRRLLLWEGKGLGS